MKLYLTLIFLAALVCQGEETAGKHAHLAEDKSPGNRFLFVFETSSAMKTSAPAAQKAIMGLLNSAMQGQMTDGDTFGIWTYNDKLTSDFPMQVWSEDNKDEILEKVSTYLGHRHYERKAHLEKVMPGLIHLIQASKTLTIIFAFDGTGQLKGTPFDQDINDLHKQYGRELRASHLPFITILAARNGEVFDYTVNSPGSIVVPHTVEPPKVTVAPPPPPPPVTNVIAVVKPPPRKIEIILSHTNTVSEAAPAPPPAPTPAVQAVVATPPVATPNPVETTPPPAPAEVPKPISTPPPTPEVKPEPAPVVVEQAKPSPQPAPVPQPVPVPVPAAQTAIATPSATDHLALLIGAFSLLTIAVTLVVFLFRRSRGAAQPSLISQSIDRPR